MKLVIITGISQGLGKAIFEHFSQGDYIMFAISRRFLPAQYELQRQNPDKYILEVQDLETLGSPTLSKLKNLLSKGRLEQLIFISNAGIVEPIGAIGNLDETALKRSVAVNLMAPIQITNCLFADTLNCGQITVINVSSGAATTPIEGWSVYCTVKAGIKMFFDVLKAQNSNNPKVKVENVDPGIMDTGMQAFIRTSSSEQFPLVEKFKRYKEENALQTAGEAAYRIISTFIGK